MAKDVSSQKKGITAARRRAITAALLIGTFLASIEVTVVATAMPSIVEQLGGLSLYPWVFSAYLVAQTVTIPLYGRLADLFGRRLTFVGGVSIFLVGSVLCGLAPSMPLLVAARAVQGLGAGSVLPLTQTIFGDLYDVAQRTKLQGVFSLVWGVSAVAGPLAGGFIVYHLDWRWVFYINLPFGLVSAAAVGLLLREKIQRKKHRLDLRGVLALSGATVVLLLALLPPQQRPLDLPTWSWILTAVGLAVVFVLHERRHPEPLLPLVLFRDRVQVAVNVAGLFLGMVLFGIVSYVPLYVQQVLGKTPMHAGAVLIPLSLGWTLATVIGGRIVRRVGFQFLVRVGSALVAVGCLLALAGVWFDLAWLGIVGIAGYGLGMGATLSSHTVSVQERVAGNQRGIATALSQFSRSIGGAVGVALLGATLASVVGMDLSGHQQGLEAGGVELLSQGLQLVFAVTAGGAVAAGLLGLVLYPKITTGQDR